MHELLLSLPWKGLPRQSRVDRLVHRTDIVNPGRLNVYIELRV